MGIIGDGARDGVARWLIEVLLESPGFQAICLAKQVFRRILKPSKRIRNIRTIVLNGCFSSYLATYCGKRGDSYFVWFGSRQRKKSDPSFIHSLIHQHIFLIIIVKGIALGAKNKMVGGRQHMP